MKRVLGLAVVVLALGAGSAGAAPFGVEEERAYKLAVDYWGAEPSLCTSLDKQVVASGVLGDGQGLATIPIGPEPCVLQVVKVYGFPGPLCDTMVHEVGHLLGRLHTTDPASVMTPDRPAMIPACFSVQRRYEIRERLKEQRRRCLRVPSPRCWNAARALRSRLAEYADL